jgi:hypothetical protein
MTSILGKLCDEFSGYLSERIKFKLLDERFAYIRRIPPHLWGSLCPRR